MHICLCGGVQVPTQAEESDLTTGGVTENCEQPEVGAGNQAQFLWQCSMSSQPLSYLSLQALSLAGPASPREPHCLFLRARVEVTHHYSFGSGDPNEVSICAGLNQNGPRGYLCI